jgi:multisubunit Na+/H+ antiporter MnhC subunit
MGKFVTLVIGCVLVIGLLMFGGADMLRQLNAPALADAQARIAEAQADIAQAEAWASVENTEEAYKFATPLAVGLLVIAAVLVGMVAVALVLLICSGPAEAFREWRGR